MRPQVAFLLALLLSVVALASAQEPGQTPPSQTAPLVLRQMISGAWEPLPLERVDGPPGPLAPSALAAADFCTDATEIGTDEGGRTYPSNMTIGPFDQVLDCMWGEPERDKGWRTVWYKLEAPRTEMVTVDTRGSNYDTVLAIYDGENGCSNLIQLACNDDHNFFTSRASVVVRAGQTYYIQVADWHKSISGESLLDVFTESGTAPSNWERIGGPNSLAQRSRHAAVMVGDQLYVIGGQSVVSGQPVRTPSTAVYNTATGKWNTLSNMRAGDDGLGYSNTPAAYVDGKIYIPTGFTGNNGIYDDTQWVYDVDLDFWSEDTTNPFWVSNGGPSIYSAAVPYTGSDGPGYYLMGGLTGPLPNPVFWEARREMYRYRPSGGWQQVPALMITGRFGHMAAVQSIDGQDHICVASGIGKDGDGPGDPHITLGDAECFDIDSGIWSPINGPNIPRYYAGSAVDSAGQWYIFGGVDASGASVPVTERYDREADRWIALDTRFDLDEPTRAWAIGGFVGQTLWVVGGQTEGDQVINLVEKMDVPLPPIQHDLPPISHMPVILKDFAADVSADTFATARPLPLNQPKQAAFLGALDVVDVYFINVPSLRSVNIRLSQIPKNSNYDLHLYSENKLWLASSTLPGRNDETINQTLGTGRYFIVVERKFPIPGTDPGVKKYQIEAQG